MTGKNECVVKLDDKFIRVLQGGVEYKTVVTVAEATKFPHYGAAKKFADKLRERETSRVMVVPKSIIV